VESESPSRQFPQLDVTSDLALHKKKADHRHGEWGAGAYLEKSPNSFVVRILTSNRYALKILQTLFAEPAPVKAFQRGKGGGDPDQVPKFPKWSHTENAIPRDQKIIFQDLDPRCFLCGLSGKSF
jgi:hypothetical protein